MADKARPKSDEWKKGPRITAEDLKEGKNGVERITAEEALKGTGSATPITAGGKRVMSFGKHKNKEWDWVKKHDAGYWNWCCENITWFAKLVKKSGA
jgi:hypothetical protein